MANMPQTKKKEKESQISEIVRGVDSHLGKCHLMLHLKDSQLKIIRMKYSEMYQELSNCENIFARDFVVPMRDLVTGYIHPIISDLLQIYDNT